MAEDGTTDVLVRAEAVRELSIANPAAAASLAAAIVAEARSAGSAEAVIVGLRAQAWSARTVLAEEDAKRLLDEAARLARRHGLRVRLADVLVARAAVHQELGKSRAAHHDLDQARQLLLPASSAELEHLAAVHHLNAGRLRDAAEIYRQVRGDRTAPIAVRAKIANNLGMIEAQFGHFSTAIGLVEQAQELAREVGPALTAYFTEGLASVLAQSGQLPASLEVFDEAERLYRAAGLPLAELHADQADAMADLGLLPEAVVAARRAAEEFDANGAFLMRAEADLRVARLALLSGDSTAAEAAARRAEASLRKQGRAGWAARATVIAARASVDCGSVTADDLRRARRAAAMLERLQMTAWAVEAYFAAGLVEMSLNRREWALASFDRAHELAARAPVLTRMKGRVAAATGAMVRDDDRGSLRHCSAGLTDLERHRAALASTELRVLASARGAELGRIGLRALLSCGTPGEVFTWMERTRAAALVAVGRPRVDGMEEELAALRALQGEMRQCPDADLPELEARQTALESRLRRMSWSSSVEGTNSTARTSMAEIRSSLDHRLLVEYGVLDGTIIAAVVGERRRTTITRLGSLQAVTGELNGLVFALRVLARRSSAPTAPAMRDLVRQRLECLRKLLLEPLAISAGDQELVIVPIDVLQKIPWSALHDGPVSVAPSGSFWVRTAERTTPSGGSLLVAGPGLPGAVEEVERLRPLHAENVLLHPPGSTVETVSTHLAGAGFAHFACHGKVRSDNPMFSGLVLSDGQLTVQELQLRGVFPHRIVLAACEAAGDVAYSGGETLGFVSALLAGGTAGIIGSVVVVPDQASIELMCRIHSHVASGDTLAHALFAARSVLDLDDICQFVNWCGFAAFGAA